MDFELTAEQQKRTAEILATVGARLPGETRTAPDDYAGREEWRVAAAAGLTGLCIPEEYGGGDLGALDTALCLESFGEACRDTGLVFGVAAHLLACAVPIRDFATGPVRAHLLPRLASGAMVAANAITEDVAGSDVGSMATTAQRAPDHYLLNGEKSFVSNGPTADVFVTYAVTDPGAGFLGCSGFVVPRDLPGVEVGPPMAKMGLHGCPASWVRFTGCRVPVSHRLGQDGQGSYVLQHSMGWERACLFAVYLGLMTAQLERCVRHARGRRQFGRRIGEFQAISHRIAIMSQRLESARLLVYRACWLLDHGAEHGTAVSMSKIAVSEASVANSLDAIQIFGGSGYLSATGIEQQLRDTVPSTIFSGTTEIHRGIIARGMGL